MTVTLGLAWKILIKTAAFILFVCGVYFARELLYEKFDPYRGPVRKSEAVLCPPLPAFGDKIMDPETFSYDGVSRCPGKIS
ncbi:MAG: hypothetical protein AB7S78_14280 [Candidatus Omnitrophota bacterium]